MNNHDTERIRRRMNTLLDTIDYDFKQFTMEGFRRYLEKYSDEPIKFVSLALRSSVSGAWVKVIDGRSFIFFDADMPTIYQSHVQLHEMSHIICGHPPVDAHTLLADIMMNGDTQTPLLLRAVHSPQVELEAEVMASLIQERVLRYGRLQELLKMIKSSQDIVDFLKIAGVA